MKCIVCFICVAFMLLSCNKDNGKFPQECKDVFEVFVDIHTHLDINRFTTPSMATNFKRLNIDEFIPNFKIALSKESYERQAFICKPIAEVLNKQLDQLKNAKSEAEIKEIFSGL